MECGFKARNNTNKNVYFSICVKHAQSKVKFMQRLCIGNANTRSQKEYWDEGNSGAFWSYT